MIHLSLSPGKVALYLCLLHLASAASVRGRFAEGSTIDDHRRLQYDCSQHGKKNQCPTAAGDPCSWEGGNCVAATTDPPTPSPSPSPTSEPTPEPSAAPVDPTPEPTGTPTPGPTNAPAVQGAGYCSDDGGASCFVAADCACGSEGGTAADVDDDGSSFRRRALSLPRHSSEGADGGGRGGGNGGHRRRLQYDCSQHGKRSQCPDGTGEPCVWSGGDCVPAPPPPATPSPTSGPTPEPTSEPATAVPTSEPTGAPTGGSTTGSVSF